MGAFNQSASKANEGLLFFLAYGGLKWEMGYYGESLFEEEDINVNQDFLSRLSAIVADSDDALKRFFQSVSPAFQQRVVDAVYSQLNPAICELLRFLSKQGTQRNQTNKIIIQAYTVCHVAKNMDYCSFAALVTLFFCSTANNMGKGPELGAAVIKFVKYNRLAGDLFNEDLIWRRVVLTYLNEVVPAKAIGLSGIGTEDGRQNMGKEHRCRAAMRSNDKGNNERMEQTAMDSTELQPKADAIYIDNAGLVIIYPFIQSLFETIGLYKLGHHVKIDALAPVVLQYVLRGDQCIKESDLPLNKILAGLTPTTFVPCGMNLSAGCMQACDELLTLLIGHWSALNGMNIARLREAFLRRRGRLEKTELGWRLCVESKGVDVLLSSLPWDMGINTVKLPWMEECLVVEWGTAVEQDTLYCRN